MVEWLWEELDWESWAVDSDARRDSCAGEEFVVGGPALMIGEWGDWSRSRAVVMLGREQMEVEVAVVVESESKCLRWPHTAEDIGLKAAAALLLTRV